MILLIRLALWSVQFPDLNQNILSVWNQEPPAGCTTMHYQTSTLILTRTPALILTCHMMSTKLTVA